MVVLGTLVSILTIIYGLLRHLGRPRGARPLLLQHAAGVDRDRHPVRAAARPRRGLDQPLDVPGEVRAHPAHRDPARRARQRHRHARAGAARPVARSRSRGASPTRRSTWSTPTASGYELAGHVGPRPEGRFDAITHRAFFERLRRAGVISLEGLEREIAARRTVSTEERESLQLMLRTLEQMNGSVALGFNGEDQLLGALVLRDERLREAYSSDEIELFRGVATHDRRDAAELAGLRAHEGARPPRGARRDGGRPGARDPQPARRDQGRGAAAAAGGGARAPTTTRASSSTSSSRR